MDSSEQASAPPPSASSEQPLWRTLTRAVLAALTAKQVSPAWTFFRCATLVARRLRVF